MAARPFKRQFPLARLEVMRALPQAVAVKMDVESSPVEILRGNGQVYKLRWESTWATALSEEIEQVSKKDQEVLGPRKGKKTFKACIWMPKEEVEKGRTVLTQVRSSGIGNDVSIRFTQEGDE